MASTGLLVAMALSTLLSIHFPGLTTPGEAGAPPNKAKTAAAVTEIHIDKSDHTLKLMAGTDVVKTYKVAIGSGGMGNKQYEGDKTTPVGTYRLNGRFKGLYRQFLNVSYPNEQDKKRFATLKASGGVPPGRSAGFGIGIHGVGNKTWNKVHKLADWTHGCIALDDDEIDELSSQVKDGTKIVITD